MAKKPARSRAKWKSKELPSQSQSEETERDGLRGRASARIRSRGSKIKREVSFRNSDVIGQWLTVGTSKNLSSDVDIARFLLSLYLSDKWKEKQLADVCARCNASLILVCSACQMSMPQTQPTNPQLSSPQTHCAVRGPSYSPPLPLPQTHSTKPQFSLPETQLTNPPLSLPETLSINPPLSWPQAQSIHPHPSSPEEPVTSVKDQPPSLTSQPPLCQVNQASEANSAANTNNFAETLAKNSTGVNACNQSKVEKTKAMVDILQPAGRVSTEVLHIPSGEEKIQTGACGSETDLDDVDDAGEEDSSGQGSEFTGHDAHALVCPFCPVVLSGASHREHVRGHPEADALTCPVCNKIFPHFTSLFNHTRLPVSQQKCESCGEIFRSYCQVTKHAQQHKREKTQFCSKCNQAYTSMKKKDFIKHMRRHGMEERRSSPKAALCPWCGKLFKMKCQLKNHMAYHNKDRPFSCSQCGKTFQNKSCLRQHELFHGEKKEQCEVCGAKYHRKVSLRRHMQKHYGKQHDCKECHSRFSSTWELHCHTESVHKGVRKFPCTLCDQRFYSSTSLKVHMRRHNGDKPFQCKECPAKFPVGSALRKHMLRHTGEKPYRCEDCGQAYRCQHSYKVHRKKQHSNSMYSCQDCPQTFHVRSSLNFHRKMCHHVRLDGPEVDVTASGNGEDLV